MASFRFELDHKPTRNKKYNLYLIVSIKNKRTKKKTGIQVDNIDDFNPKAKHNNWIRSNVLKAKVFNEQLRLLLIEAQATYINLEDDGQVTSAGIIRELNKETISPSFIEFTRERAKQIEDEGGFRNARKYYGLANKLDVFKKKQHMHDITMEDLTVELLTKFNTFLHKWKNEREPDKVLHTNTIAVQFNICKTLVNRAIDIGHMLPEKNPFLRFKYKEVMTVKEKLDMAEIQKIIDLDLEEGSLIWHVRNYFMFSFYCAGIRASDLIKLRWRNITVEGRLNYTMNKNGKTRDMILVPQAQEILKHYFQRNVKPDDYIFPLLDNKAKFAKYVTVSDQMTMTPELKKVLCGQVSAKNALINKYLKKIAEKAEITKNVSMHIARHSFAKIAKENEMDSSVVKELLAHSNLATTERYMGTFDTKKTDSALIDLFDQQKAFKKQTELNPEDKKAEIIEMMKGMTAEEIMSIITSINK